MLSTIWSMYVNFTQALVLNRVFIYAMGAAAGATATHAYQEAKKTIRINKEK